jgi:predicted DCC family thiol-disulfide oxidoreductase YuxK
VQVADVKEDAQALALMDAVVDVLENVQAPVRLAVLMDVLQLVLEKLDKWSNKK